MRVAIADDSALFRRGLAELLTAAGLDVVREAKDADELLAYLLHDRPDVVVLDIRMPPTFTDEGLLAAAAVRERSPSTGVLVLSTYSETTYAVRLVEGAGASGVGYLLKDRVDDVDALRDALARVCSGQHVIDPDIVTRLFARRGRLQGVDALSPKEREVLRHLAEGRSNAGVGSALGLSPRTVEAHVNAVFTKLDLTPAGDVNRRVLAVLTWLRAGG